MNVFRERTLRLRYQSLAIPVSRGTVALLVPRVSRAMGAQNGGRHAKHRASFYRDGRMIG